MTLRYFIYGLTDPRTAEIRYVGQSSTGMRRPKEHWLKHYLERDAHLHSTRWVKVLLGAGLKPAIVILEQVSSEKELDASEVKWISYGRAEGWRLTNITAGGGGARGYKHSEVSREKLRAARAIRPATSDETRAKMSASQKELPAELRSRRAYLGAARVGHSVSAEIRRKIGDANRGRAVSADTRAKMSASGKKRAPPSAEARAKMSASAKARGAPLAAIAANIGRKRSSSSRPLVTQ